MKKFVTNYPGLIPIVLDDLRFMETASTEMIEALVGMFCELTNSNSFILNGVKAVAGNPIMLTAGWVVLNGKIYRVEEQEFPQTEQGDFTVFKITTNILAGGNKLMKPTLAQVNTWYDYKATVISKVTPPVSNDVLWGLQRLKDIINEITAITTIWTPLTLNQDWASDTSGDYAAASYILKNNVVYLRGHVYKTGSSSTICVLPEIIHPTSVIGQSLFSIAINGAITTAVQSVILDGISYLNI